MPTNLLRNRKKSPPSRKAIATGGMAPRRVLIRAGRVAIHAELLATATAERIWAALPIYSTAETWGEAIHFETPVETGREKGARAIAQPGDIAFWCEEDRVMIAFGKTPIARAGEPRLPRPANIWARALDDTSLLKSVRPGEKVSVTAT